MVAAEALERAARADDLGAAETEWDRLEREIAGLSSGLAEIVSAAAASSGA